MSSFPFNLPPIELPLSKFPYNSRVGISEVTATQPKNYVQVAFRPGFPLQASELNEIQDIFTLNQTLTTSMINLWEANRPTETIDTPIAGLPDGPSKIYGPGWLGTTPLWPSKFSSDTEGPTSNLVEYTISGQNVTVTAKKGWYLVYVKSSASKHWFYLNEDLQTIVTADTNTRYVGFEVYYTDVYAADDGSLYDNSNTSISIGTPAGANRIKLNIITETGLKSTLQYYEPLGTYTTEDAITVVTSFSPIAKINSNYAGQPIRYMNDRNVPLAT